MPLVKAFQTAMRRRFPDTSVFNAYQMEGYVVAKLVEHGLRRMRVTSPASLAAAIRASGRIDLGGYHLDYTDRNEGSSYVEMRMIDANGAIRS